MWYKLTRGDGRLVVPIWNREFWRDWSDGQIRDKAFTSRLKTLKQFSDIYREASKTIHGIADLYDGVEMGHIKIYLGRSDTNNFLSNCSFKSRNGYDGCVPICKVDIKNYKRAEKFAIFLLKKQKEKGALCVGDVLNQQAFGGGPGATAMPILYVAWKISPRESSIGKPSKEVRWEIARVANEKYDGETYCPGVSSLIRALEGAFVWSRKIKLSWPSEYRSARKVRRAA